MRLSRILRPEDLDASDTAVPMGRVLLWALVWIGVLSGVALYFKYARLLTPLLG